MRWMLAGAVTAAAMSLRAQATVAALDTGALERAVQAAEALGARTGVVVAEVDGTVRYAHRGSETFAPASNMKLLTAAAVLRGLGPDFAFVTRFRLAGGRLVVEASGDPNLIAGSADAPAAVFGDVVAALRRAGVAAVRAIELDAGVFQGPLRPATWPRDQLETYYCAPTGPFVLEQGTFALDVRPGDGTAAAAIAAPLVDFPLRGAIALAPARKGAVYGAVDAGGAVKLSGKLWRRSAPAQIRVAVRDPAAWYEAALRRALREGGIAVDAAAPDTADRPLCEHRSALRPALLRMLQDSSNFDAEQCLRVLGAERRRDGSLAGGIAAARELLAAMLGTEPAGFVMADGSGLSRDNRVSPALVVAAVQASLGGPGADLWLACLPVGGASGTLEDRFRNSAVGPRVHAKTGWIRGASALSGVLSRSGGPRLFAILMNYDRDVGGLNGELKALQERMVAAMDGQ